jgi:putative flippase GtrA
MSHRPYDVKDGHGVLRMERMSAETPGVKGNHTGARGLLYGRDVYKYLWQRLPAPLARELVRYTCVGGLASLVDVGMLVVLTHCAGVYYLHAATLAFGLGLLTSYLLSIAWVFQERKFHNPFVEVGLFTLIGGLGLLGNGICMWLLTEYAHLHYLCSKLVAALLVFLGNFVAKKWVLFRR